MDIDEIYDIRNYDIQDVIPAPEETEERETMWEDWLSSLPVEQAYGITEITDVKPEYDEKDL